jgi:hypothetical protein
MPNILLKISVLEVLHGDENVFARLEPAEALDKAVDVLIPRLEKP